MLRTFQSTVGEWRAATTHVLLDMVLLQHIAAATVFGSSINRAAKLVALPADLIPRFEAARDPLELDADIAQPR